MSPSECSRLRCGNQLFDAVVRLYPLVAVHTLDLGEYLQLQVVGEGPLLAEMNAGVLGLSDVSKQPRA